MAHWWTDIAPGRSRLEPVTVETFHDLVMEAPPNRRMDEVFLHHTWKPRAEWYDDLATWEGIQDYHVDAKGWSDIGYHVGVGPDGSVWLLRPVQKTGAHCQGYNGYSIGVAMIGNYDVGEEDPEACLPTAVKVMAILCKRFALTETNVRFHTEFSSKTCPGSAINLASVRARVAAALDAPPEQPHWAQAEIDWAVENGIMDGTRADDPATRAEVVTMLRRALEG
jgi:hypothetical protein